MVSDMTLSSGPDLNELEVVGYFDYITDVINQSINQYIYNVPWYRGACYSADYAEAKRNVLSRVLNVLTDGAVRQFRGIITDVITHVSYFHCHIISWLIYSLLTDISSVSPMFVCLSRV